MVDSGDSGYIKDAGDNGDGGNNGDAGDNGDSGNNGDYKLGLSWAKLISRLPNLKT